MGQPKISVALGGAGENLGRFRWGRFSARRRFGWGPPFRRFGWGPNKKFRFRWGRQNDCACGARSAGRDQGCVGWLSARTLRGHVLLCSRWTCSRVTDARTTPRERYARSGFPGGHFPRRHFVARVVCFFRIFACQPGAKIHPRSGNSILHLGRTYLAAAARVSFLSLGAPRRQFCTAHLLL